ncbi:MAG: hypothetical protein J5726_04160 [Treponema sp.]|nr:hypothetical protein [Treponema sp.]
METIKNYLESMFRNLPNTDEVLKAKRELLQMMEDKYTELIREGKTENEAVAKVIAEFGNLDEVSASLGIKEVIGEKKERNRRNVTMEEIKEYINDKIASILFTAIGVALFILCPVPTIILGEMDSIIWVGPTLLFVLIAVGVALCILGGNRTEQWRFIKYEPCSISPSTADFVVAEKRKFQSVHTAMFCTGIALCVCCSIPAIIIGDGHLRISENWGGVFVLLFVAVGVAFIIYSSSRYKLYQKLLALNSEETIGGAYVQSKDKEPVYTNKTVRVIMSVYWPSVTCVYLCISFLTFQWGITWIIWPIAGVVRRLIDSIYGGE